MYTYLDSLYLWGYQVIQAVQEIRAPWLDLFFRFLTRLGNTEGYILLFPIFYWCINDRWGRRLGILSLGSFAVNMAAKLSFMMPRPATPWVDVLVHESTPSFPSGHAQGTSTFWGYLAVLWRNWPFRIAVFFIILGVGLSRIYLGAHFPQDIFGGWLISLALLIAFVKFEPGITRWLLWMGIKWQIMFAIIIPLNFIAYFPTAKVITINAAWTGFAIGMILDYRYLRFSSDGSMRNRLLRLLGVVVVFALWIGLKAILPPGAFWRYIRYCIVGFSFSGILPWIFVRLGWAETSPLTPPQHPTEVEA